MWKDTNATEFKKGVRGMRETQSFAENENLFKISMQSLVYIFYLHVIHLKLIIPFLPYLRKSATIQMVKNCWIGLI